jgi:hypothetical protein
LIARTKAGLGSFGQIALGSFRARDVRGHTRMPTSLN